MIFSFCLCTCWYRPEEKHCGTYQQQADTCINAIEPIVFDQLQLRHRTPSPLFAIVAKLIDIPPSVTERFIDQYSRAVDLAILSV